MTEPWLRGKIPDTDPVIGYLLRSSQHIREDIAGLTEAEFNLKHLAGSTDRLCSYLEGNQLTPEQMASMARENEPGGDAATWIAAVNQSLDRYEAIISNLKPEQFGDIREVGRRRLQTTAIGLAIHIVEHGQRHTGQALTTRGARTPACRVETHLDAPPNP